MQKGYCKTVLASQGKLTKELFDKINNGDEPTMRRIFEEQKQIIIDSTQNITNKVGRSITLTQADSVQEVLDNLTEMLNA